MSSTLLQPFYSYEFSRGVVEEFIDSHSRATLYVAGILGLDGIVFKKKLIESFRRNQQVWNRAKEVIKIFDDDELRKEISRYSSKIRRYYLTYFKYLADEWFISTGNFKIKFE
jgi:hypothetical protein